MLVKQRVSELAAMLEGEPSVPIFSKNKVCSNILTRLGNPDIELLYLCSVQYELYHELKLLHNC